MNPQVRKIALSAVALVGGYLCAWFTAFSVLVGPEYGYAPEYFVASWFGGGELPATIQLFALMLTAAGAVAVLAVRYVHSRLPRRTSNANSRKTEFDR